jgi:hypothetical protein
MRFDRKLQAFALNLASQGLNSATPVSCLLSFSLSFISGCGIGEGDIWIRNLPFWQGTFSTALARGQ